MENKKDLAQRFAERLRTTPQDKVSARERLDQMVAEMVNKPMHFDATTISGVSK